MRLLAPYRRKQLFLSLDVIFCFLFLFMVFLNIESHYFLFFFFSAALERELWSSATINEEVLRTLNVIFANFPKLHISEAATLCIPLLIGVLKSGSEAAQESVLDTLCLLRHSWSTMPIDIAKSQAMVASEAIPTLQMLMKTCPPSFHDRADSLLHCLPGCLTVTIRRGNHLKQAMGSTNAFCRLTIGNGPARQTKVIVNVLKEAMSFLDHMPGSLLFLGR